MKRKNRKPKKITVGRKVYKYLDELKDEIGGTVSSVLEDIVLESKKARAACKALGEFFCCRTCPLYKDHFKDVVEDE